MVKNLPANSGNVGDVGSIPVSGRSPGEVSGNPLQYSCLENQMDRKAWWTTVHGVASVGHDLAIKPPPPPPKIKIKPTTCVALIVGNSLTQTCLECPGASSGGVGQQWPAAALGALSVGNVCTGPYEGGRRYLHYLPHSLVSGQTTEREHSPTQQQKIGLKIYWAWHPIRTRPFPPQSVSLIRKLS